MSEIKLKYLCKSFSSSLVARDLNMDLKNGYPVFGASGIMGYRELYDSKCEYLGIIKDGAGVGRVNLYPAKSSLLGTMASIIPNQGININWLKYAIMNLDLGNSVDKATIPHIYFSVYGNSFVLDIQEEHQKIIASFLDNKCNHIDALISNQHNQIEKLKAYKQSIITETVTKGLNKDVPLQDSGVEWIGDIPEGWRVIQMKHMMYIRARLGWKGLKAEEYVDDGYTFIGTPNIDDNGKIDYCMIKENFILIVEENMKVII